MTSVREVHAVEALIPATPLLLMLDFDGTLVPIADHPDAVSTPQGLPELLTQLASQGHELALITGRPARQVIERLGSAFTVVGLHGAEWPGEPLPQPPQQLEYCRRVLDALCRATPGLWLEDKGLTLAAHTRQVADEQLAEVESAVLESLRPCLQHAHCAVAGVPVAGQDEAPPKPLELIRGNRVFELRPGTFNKGNAVRRLMQRTPHLWPVYIGDDTTDEDAFGQLANVAGLGIRVGPAGTPSRARATLPDPFAVRALLTLLSGRAA